MQDKKIHLYWENNSRAVSMANQDKIKHEDIVPRSRTDEFLDEAATVRLHRVRDKKPFVTIHIRGKNRKQTNSHGFSWNYAPVCRGSYSNTMCSNGDLDEDYSWQDVHNLVEETKAAMEIN